MTREIHIVNQKNAIEFLNNAKLAIVEGNFWLAKSYLKSAIASANKAGSKRMACAAMRALQNVNLARA